LSGTVQEWTILREAIENTNEGFVTIDENHQVLIFNKAAEKIFGYSREEVIGNDLAVVLAPQCTEGHKQAVSRFLQTGKSKLIGHQTEFLTTRKNGERFPLSISFSLSKVEGKIFFTGLIRDLTETKALEEQIAKSERLAALGQLVAEITHEIKNPLIMIGGFARQLSRIAQDEKSRSKLTIITEEVQRLEKLILELSQIYRPQTLSTEPININLLLAHIFSLSQEDCAHLNIALHLETPETPLWVEGDSEKLKQVFLNLVKNAMEALEKGGELSIRAEQTGDRVDIKIIDNGPGVQAQNRNKLFTPFFTTKRRGTGLGLSVSKRIIENHPGGTLDLDSVEGKGTTVRISLPLSQGPTHREGPQS
jgi:two-component system, LuxR family, sensor kinase FixL